MYSGKPLLEVFLRHESSQYRPGLSSGRSLSSCTKSKESCTSSTISFKEEPAVPDFLDLIIIYGGALIHSVPGTNVQGWSSGLYFYKFFCPRDRHELKRSTRVDIVWDQYLALTIKGGTKGKEGQAPDNMYLQ